MVYKYRTFLFFDDAMLIAHAAASVHNVHVSIVPVRSRIGDHVWQLVPYNDPWAQYVALAPKRSPIPTEV